MIRNSNFDFIPNKNIVNHLHIIFQTLCETRPFHFLLFSYTFFSFHSIPFFIYANSQNSLQMLKADLQKFLSNQIIWERKSRYSRCRITMLGICQACLAGSGPLYCFGSGWIVYGKLQIKSSAALSLGWYFRVGNQRWLSLVAAEQCFGNPTPQ